MSSSDTMQSTFMSAETDVQRAITRIREQLFHKGAHSTLKLRKAFHAADIDGSGCLDRDEFSDAVAFAGIFLKTQEIGSLFRTMDVDGSNAISISEFLRALCSTLSERRMNFISKVYHVLEQEFGGEPTVQQLKSRIHAEKHPDVAAGLTTPQELRQEFVDDIQDAMSASNSSDKVSLDTFTNYYADAGAAMPSDDFFATTLEREWGVSEAALARSEEEKIQYYVDTMKEKARQKARPNENERLFLERTCKFFDDDETGSIEFESFRDVLARLGVPLSRGDAKLIFDYFPQAQDGGLDYKTFVSRCFA